MDAARFLDHPLLEKSRRDYHAGDFLFRQGEVGQSLFVIHSGSVRLVGVGENGAPYTAALVGPGDFLGEKIILNDKAHPRFFSAVAETDVVAVEMGPTDIMRLEKDAPYLVKNLFKRSLELAEARLERANGWIRILRSSDNGKRFSDCLRFVAKTFGRNTVDGTVLTSPAATIHMHIDLTPSEIDARLAVLTAKGLLIAKDKDSYLIPDLEKIG